MGYHSDSEREKDLREAYNGPVATAVPGYSLLDEKEPNGEPQPVIAWRIGRSWTLPVTTLGCMVGEQAVVQTFATDAAKCSGTLCGLCGENCIPDFWRGFAIDAKLSERELTFPDPMHEFNAGDGDRGAPKALQSKHWTQTKFDRSMVLLYQII